jgi:hypothetical protein
MNGYRIRGVKWSDICSVENPQNPSVRGSRAVLDVVVLKTRSLQQMAILR